jgi:hypothetical protein
VMVGVRVAREGEAKARSRRWQGGGNGGAAGKFKDFPVHVCDT